MVYTQCSGVFGGSFECIKIAFCAHAVIVIVSVVIQEITKLVVDVLNMVSHLYYCTAAFIFKIHSLSSIYHR